MDSVTSVSFTSEVAIDWDCKLQLHSCSQNQERFQSFLKTSCSVGKKTNRVAVCLCVFVCVCVIDRDV